MFLYNKQEGVREDSLFLFSIVLLILNIIILKTIRLDIIIIKQKTVCHKADTQFLKFISLLFIIYSFYCFKNHYLTRPRFLRVALSNIKYLRYCFSERIVCMYFKSLLIALPTIASRSSAGAIAAFIISAVKFL